MATKHISLNTTITYQEIIGFEVVEYTNVNLDKAIVSISTDSRIEPNNNSELFVAIKGEQFDAHNFIQESLKIGYNAFVVSDKHVFEELSQKNKVVILVRNTLRFVQYLARLHRLQFDIPVIGITGSNGKTICKEWLYELLKDDYRVHRSPKSYNSQIGVALSLLELNPSHELAIIEAGISQKGEMSILENMIQPTFGLFTNNLEAHVEGFKSLEDKNEEKHLLFQNLDFYIESNDYALEEHKGIWNTEEVQIKPIKNGSRITVNGDEFEISFSNQIYIENAIHTYLVAKHFTKHPEELKKRMIELSSISLRWEEFEGRNGNVIINDSYSLDLGSLRSSISQMNQLGSPQNTVLFIGFDKKRKYNFSEYAELINLLDPIEVIVYDFGFNELAEHLHKYDILCTHFDEGRKLEYQDTTILFKSARGVSLSAVISKFKLKNHRTKLEIDLSKMKDNLLYYNRLIDNKTKLLVMVKASSYGAGLKEITNFLGKNNVDYLGVAFTDEGLKLREKGVQTPILVMNPDETYFDEGVDQCLEPTVYSLDHLDKIIRVLIQKNQKQYPVHIKIDSGMNRLGFKQNQLEKLVDAIKSQPEVKVKSILSHFSSADDPNQDEKTEAQFQMFKENAEFLKKELGYEIDFHICNSAGSLRFPQYHLDMIRLGIGLHGIVLEDKHLKPTISLKSYITQVNDVQQGGYVGYSDKYLAPSDMKIGVVPIGYADGITRSFGVNGGFVSVNQQKCPVIGNVCMDMLMIDLSSTDIQVGDEVEFFGEEISIEEHAQFQNTIAYEVISRISERVPRIYIR